MSILSSTKSGVRAYHLKAQDLINRGYRVNDGGTSFYPTKNYKPYLYAKLTPDGSEIDHFQFSFSLQSCMYNFKVRTIQELVAIEKIWNAKTQKDRINKQKALVKIALDYKTAELGKRVKIGK